MVVASIINLNLNYTKSASILLEFVKLIETMALEQFFMEHPEYAHLVDTAIARLNDKLVDELLIHAHYFSGGLGHIPQMSAVEHSTILNQYLNNKDLIPLMEASSKQITKSSNAFIQSFSFRPVNRKLTEYF